MLTAAQQLADYGRCLDEWSCALVRGRLAGLAGAVREGAKIQVEIFAHNLRAKRMAKLEKQLEYLQAGFSNLSALVADYAGEVAPIAHEHGNDDILRCLDWLTQRGLTPEQRDLIACQRARQAVQEAGRRDRDAYAAFLELSRASEVARQIATVDSTMTIVPNPALARETFHTGVVLGAEDELPANALIYAVDGEIRTAVFDGEACDLIAELLPRRRWTLSDWCSASARDRKDRLDFVLELVEMGVVALAFE